MISKLALRSMTGGVKAFLKPSLVALYSKPVYNFAQVPAANKGKGKLIQVLDKEIKYEEENYESEQSAKDYITNQGFEIRDVADEFSMEIHKKVGDDIVTIQFNPKQLPADEQTPEDQEDPENQGMGPEDFFEFTVYITRKDNLTMAYECLLLDGEFEIDTIKVIYDYATYQKMPKIARNLKSYPGPQLYTLDENLRDDLYDYLESFGIDKDLAKNIETFAIDREQRLYMRWLTQVRDFVDAQE